MPLRVEERHNELGALYRLVFGDEQPKASTPPVTPLPVSLTDQDILERARRAANSSKFTHLYQYGDVGAYGSHSEADLALCSLLAFWCGPDAQQIDRLFRMSALYREKWNERRRADYCHGDGGRDLLPGCS